MTLKIFNQLKLKSFQNRFESVQNRIQKLQKMQNWIKKNELLILESVHSDFNKPHFETAMSEIMIVLNELKYFKTNLKSWVIDQIVSTPISLFGHKSKIRYENKGVILIISPWNYPFQLAINPLIAAISAGNTVVIKPSELTPATALLLQKMCSEIFEIDDVVVELGDKEKTNELMNYQFDHVFFTGSTNVGRIIAVDCAKKLIPYTLELGGKSPVIITESADIDDAISKIHWGKYLNRGQTCVAPDYVLVHDIIQAEFQTRFNSYSKSIDQKQNPEKISQIISKKHQSRLDDLNSGQFDFKKSAVELIQIKNIDHPLMADEIFGPTSPVIGYSDLKSAVEIILKYPDPLAFYIFSKNNAEIEFLLKSIPSGGVGINSVSVHLANHHLPFGGRGNSGQGRYHGHFGFLEFSHHRAIIEQKFLKQSLQILFPPYTELKMKLLKILRFMTN